MLITVGLILVQVMYSEYKTIAYEVARHYREKWNGKG